MKQEAKSLLVSIFVQSKQKKILTFLNKWKKIEQHVVTCENDMKFDF